MAEIATIWSVVKSPTGELQVSCTSDERPETFGVFVASQPCWQDEEPPKRGDLIEVEKVFEVPKSNIWVPKTAKPVKTNSTTTIYKPPIVVGTVIPRQPRPRRYR